MAAAIPPPPPPALLCPNCRSPVAPDARFCPACGATLGAPPPPPPGGAPPVDLRSRVDADRGFLKRVQLLIPGFNGYRQGEDIRAADSLLRMQVADRVARARGTVESARSSLTQSAHFDRLNDLAQLISELMRLEGEIRHAEQGYTGLSPAVRIGATGLDQLYQYDYGFASAADQLTRGLEGLPTIAGTGDPAAIGAVVQMARGQVAQLDSAFKARIRAIEGIQV